MIEITYSLHRTGYVVKNNNKGLNNVTCTNSGWNAKFSSFLQCSRKFQNVK